MRPPEGENHMIDEVGLLRLIDEQRAAIIAEAGEGDEYRDGCSATLQWVRVQIEWLSRATPVADQAAVVDTEAQVAALATAVEAIAGAGNSGRWGQMRDVVMAMRQAIPKESGT